MSTSEDTTPAVSTPAKRGDLVVVISRHLTAVVQGEAYENQQIVLGRVSSVTRSGLVKRYQVAMFADADDREQTVRPREQVFIVGADTVDVEAVLVQYRKHTWGSTGGSGSDMVRPYESLNEVKDLVQPWLYNQS